MSTFQLLFELIRLGHARGPSSAADLVHALVGGAFDVAEAVRSFQAFHGLEPTGVLADVADKLAAARCGHPDVMASSSAPCRWPDPNVTFNQRVTLPQLPASRVAALYRQAWDQWAAVCGLNPVEVADPTPVHAVNVFARQGDGLADQFDSAGTILAWSQLPCGVSADATLSQVFNDREPWTEGMFLAVACHEIGHAIGLPHRQGRCLMNPYYDPSITAPTDLDAADAQALYGPPAAPPAAPPTAAPGLPTPPPPPGLPSAASFVLNVTEAGSYLVTLSVAKQG